MIYIETNSTDACYNFALEYYFTAEKQLEEDVFLLWRTEPTLMIGKYQNTVEEINQKYAQQHGIRVVRRMSGGGTIYTDMGGWQFTFIAYGDSSGIHFEKYISPLIQAMEALGVKAEFNGRNDLLVAGKKVSGNAQYKLKGNTVHHGSLLFNTNIDQMVKSTTVDAYKIISKSIKSIRERVTNIGEHLPTLMSTEQFKSHIISYVMVGSEKRYDLTKEDELRIEEIADERFRSWESSYGANPKYSITETGRFDGGKIAIGMDVKRGHIVSAQIWGDFFGTEQAELIADVLVGCRMEKEDIIAKLSEHRLDEAIYGITLEEITETITS